MVEMCDPIHEPSVLQMNRRHWSLHPRRVRASVLQHLQCGGGAWPEFENPSCAPRVSRGHRRIRPRWRCGLRESLRSLGRRRAAGTFRWISPSYYSPNSSRGVTRCGVERPNIVLTLEMWSNLLALAKCLQFQVTRNRHPWNDAMARCRASPVGLAGITRWRMYAATISATASGSSSRGTGSKSSDARLASGIGARAISNTTALLVTKVTDDDATLHQRRVHSRRATDSTPRRAV